MERVDEADEDLGGEDGHRHEESKEAE